MSNFNFNSQVCTSRERSERLLALGLLLETADCYWFYCDITKEWKCTILSSTQVFKDYPKTVIPAWSLHRLFQIYTNGVISSSWNMAKFNWDDLIDCIEDSIVKEHFNKEYLV